MNESDQKLGPVLIGISDPEVGSEEEFLLHHPAVGGVVLFTRNYENPAQLTRLTQSIRDVSGRPLLICVDHEGGRVQRFREGFTSLPPLAVLGRLYDEFPDQALDMSYRHGRVMATELLIHGVDLSFAPVLDLGRESCVIGDRAFASTPDAVARLGAYYLAGMHDAGMKTCGKHFPGHGSVAADSHVDDVCDKRPLPDLEKSDIEPFRKLLSGLDSLMMAHVVYSTAAAEPAGYSAFWIGNYLRGGLGFEGTVFSDDLGMHAAGFAGKLPGRLEASLQAGCDAALVCDPAEAASLLAELGESPADATRALGRLRGRCPHTVEELETVGEWRHWKKSLEELENTKWA
jgi:beta-N-acetylhexosaminidase